MEHDFGSGPVPPQEQVQVYGWLEVAHPADVLVFDSAGTLPHHNLETLDEYADLFELCRKLVLCGAWFVEVT